MITEVIQHYHPEWEAPSDTGREWIKCLCPFHREDNPSAAVSYQHEAFNCFACDWRGDAYSIIQRKEGVKFGEAVRIAERLLEASGDGVRRPTAGESSGGAPTGSGLVGRRPGRRNSQVPVRVRRRPLTGL